MFLMFSFIVLFFRLFFCLSRFLSVLSRFFLFHRIIQYGPAECLYQQNTDKCADAVYPHILYRRSSAVHKRLMIFVQSCECHTYDSCQDHQPDSSYTVYIQWKRNRDCQQKILCHMGRFSHIIVDTICLICKLVAALFSDKMLLLISTIS